MNEQTIKRISTWGKFLGILFMIVGGISAVLGLFAFVVGAIPGVLTIIMGYFIFSTGRHASDYLENNSEASLDGLLGAYGNYLLLTGILAIIYIIIMLITLAFTGLSILTLLNNF